MGMNPMSMFGGMGNGGMPNPFGVNNNYMNDEQRRQMESQNRQMMDQFERCLVTVIEDGKGEFIDALERRLGDSHYSMAERGGRRGGGRSGGRGYGRSEYGGNDGGSSYASRDRDYRKERGRRGGREGECMQGLWMEIEELEKKSKKTPGFNMKNHLKKEFPDLDEEEVKVLSLFAEKGGMHQFARELGMEVDELYEVLMDVAEKVDMERR